MAVLDPVTPFLALIDRVIALIRERNLRQKELFDNVIEPLYQKFTTIGPDYIKLFRDARDLLSRQHEGNDPQVILRELRARREELRDARIQLRALIAAYETRLAQREDDDILEFLGALHKFFSLRLLASFGEVSTRNTQIELSPSGSTLDDKVNSRSSDEVSTECFKSEELTAAGVRSTHGSSFLMEYVEASIAPTAIGEGHSFDIDKATSSAQLHPHFWDAVLRLEATWFELAGRYADLQMKYKLHRKGDRH